MIRLLGLADAVITHGWVSQFVPRRVRRWVCNRYEYELTGCRLNPSQSRRPTQQELEELRDRLRELRRRGMDQ